MIPIYFGEIGLPSPGLNEVIDFTIKELDNTLWKCLIPFNKSVWKRL